MIMSGNQVQYTPMTASTQDCLSSLYSHQYELTAKGMFSVGHASLSDRPPSANSPSALKHKVTLSLWHCCELTIWWNDSQHPPPCPSTLSKYLSKLSWLWPPSLRSHCLQVHLQTRSITASKFAQLWPPSVYLHSRWIISSKCISKLAPIIPPSVSTNLVAHDLAVPLYIHSIMVSKCICKYAWLPPPSASPNSLNHGLRVYLWVHSSVIFSRPSNWSEAHPAASSDIPCGNV